VSERWPGDPTGVEEREDDKEEESDDELPVAEEEEEQEELPRLRAPEEGEQHAFGELDIPDDVYVLEGSPDGTRRGVAIVASRFNGEITNKRLEAAIG